MRILFLSIILMANTWGKCIPSSSDHIYESYNYNPSKYIYSKDCHVDYGRLRQSEPLLKKQVELLNKAISLKDLALEDSKKRTELWKETSYKLEKNILKLEKNNEKMKIIYFGLGILVTSGIVWATRN